MRDLTVSAAFCIAILTAHGTAPSAAVPALNAAPRPVVSSQTTSEQTSNAAPEPMPAAPAHASPVLDHAVNRSVGFGMLHLPQGFSPETCDLVIHFHGADTTLKPQFDAALPSAALLVVNAGMQSGPYESRYADAAALDRTLVATQNAMNDLLGERKCGIGRVALSAWSAGFGAVLRILAHEHELERVDAVLLADGMHAAYRDKRAHRVDPIGMKPFARFAALAADGQKLMSVTHSKISTYGYASTTETASFLIQDMGLSKSAQTTEGPGSMVMTYRSDRRGFHVKGFEGEDAAAHCEHLYHIRQTLFADLRDRWSDR